VPFEKSQNIFYLIDKYNIKIVEQNYGEKGIIIKVMGNKRFVEDLKGNL
jgi:putative IMPACT (imprinted ancient) family translation regulator